MIVATLRDKNVCLAVTGQNHELFSTIIKNLKMNNCAWEKETKTWIISALRYDSIKQGIEDLDIIEEKFTAEDLLEAQSCKSTQIIEKVRRIPDYSIMNFPPIKGIHPNEKFQNEGISKGINRSCYAFYWGMGSGKSYVASALIAHRLYKYHDCSKVVLITTNVGVLNLYHELFKFIKGLDESKVKIANKYYRNPFDDPSTDIVVTSYNSFRLVCNYYKSKKKISSNKPRKPFLPLKEWAGDKPLMLILDESHCVANTKSQQGHLVSIHAPLFQYRYEFSGTPADKVEKEYNQFKILDPALVWNLSYTEWLEKMADIGDHFSKYSIRAWKREEVEKQNQRFLKSYGNYFKTADLVDLPEYLEKRIYVPMSASHRKIYEELVVADLDGPSSTRDIVSRFPYLMLSIDNPFLLEKHRGRFDVKLNSLLDKFKEKDLAKFEVIDDILEDHEGEKGIIWAIHPDSIHRLEKRYANYNPVCITGETPQEERFKRVENFKKDPKHKLLIANIMCLNTSVTITEATFQIYAERSFDFTTYDQSTARAYRIGQTNNFHSYLLMYDKSLDVLLDKSLKNKGALVKGLVSKEFLSQEQWKTIFNCKEESDVSFAN